jgi:4-diphosphocytidyl-2-C-methyl-D-erythritol kinase
MAITVRSHAKVNLGLGIGAPRPDGFHELVTVYQTLEVHDLVTVSARLAGQTRISVTSNDHRVPGDGRNTAWKMVELALDGLGVTAEVAIHIEKRLPVQGGLGAGSANAVAALVGLEAELGQTAPNSLSHLSRKDNYPAKMGHPEFGVGWGAERLRLAERVGSDVPLFLIGGTVLGIDRGQSVFPLPDIEETWCVVALPSIGVSTPGAFRDWDELCVRDGLTAAASTDKLSELSRVYASSFAGVESWAGSSGVPSERGDLAGPLVSVLVRTGIVNDFERVVFPQYPLLSEIKCVLAASGTPEAALHASLSGSGSALFGFYRGQGDAEAARVRLGAMGVDSLLTRTLPRRDYWREMLQK